MRVLSDLLWNGKLKIYQDTEMFMYSLDSVLLAQFVTINLKTKRVLDIGTGNAPIPLILASKYNVKVTGVEIQKDSYILSCDSVNLNKMDDRIELINGDIKEVYKNLKSEYYDVITCNPPFYKIDMLTTKNEKKLVARNEIYLSLDDIFLISKRLLKNKGRVAIINRPERLIDIIMSMKKYNIEPKIIRFVYPKVGKKANHVLVEGIKNGNSQVEILSPLYVHNEDNSYTEEIQKMLN